MKYHYCYKIEFEEVEHVYYGSRSATCLPKHDIKYMGSPVTYKSYWELCTPIKTILETGFETRTEAIAYERELIIQQWIKNRSLSLNAHIPGENFHCVDGWSIRHAKTFIGISPDGEQVTFTNAAKFCRENPDLNFLPANIITCAKGRRPHYKGWQFFYYEDKDNIAPDLPLLKIGSYKTYVGVSPTGKYVKFTNCTQFVKDNPEWNFNPSSISACAKGGQEMHRNWQFLYHEDYLALDGLVSPPKTKKRLYVGVDPSGISHTFTNIPQFVQDHPTYKLSISNISFCLAGKNKCHKNWQFFYKEDYDTFAEDIKPIIYGGGPRTFIGISPQGVTVSFTNAAQFCRENPELKLDSSSITACAKGKIQSHREWKFLYIEDYIRTEGNITPIKRQHILGISPEGEQITFSNIQKFCNQNPDWNFDPSSIGKCCRGRLKSHKGWKFSYADESDIA